jgi:hypothetical protein
MPDSTQTQGTANNSVALDGIYLDLMTLGMKVGYNITHIDPAYIRLGVCSRLENTFDSRLYGVRFGGGHET